jgi:hypothetical protein
MINFTKGWPSMYVVDLAIPVSDSSIVEGMGLSVNTAQQWVKGHVKGKLGFVGLPAQFPGALDVQRHQGNVFSDQAYPAGVAEMGAQNMGGIALNNPLEFQTDQYDTGTVVAGVAVYVPNTGLFTQTVNTATNQVAGWCRYVGSDLNSPNNPSYANWQGAGNLIADIYSVPAITLP